MKNSFFLILFIFWGCISNAQIVDPGLSSQLEESFQERARLMREISMLEYQLNELREENKQLTNDYKNLEFKYNLLRDQLSDKDKLINNLNNQLKLAYDVIGRNTEELERATDNSERLQNELGVLQSDLDIIANKESGFITAHGVAFVGESAIYKIEVDVKTGEERVINPRAFKGNFDHFLYETNWMVTRSERNINWTEVPGYIVIYEDNNYYSSFFTKMERDYSFEARSKLLFHKKEFAKELTLPLKRNNDYKFAFIFKYDYEKNQNFIEGSTFWITCEKGLFLFATEEECEYDVSYTKP